MGKTESKLRDSAGEGDLVSRNAWPMIRVISFGYKEGAPPSANAVFDVRFLKNPYWVEELRPLSGLDVSVQQYVMEQNGAVEFIDSICAMLTSLLPMLREKQVAEFTIAFGCTGGQHRSATLVETLANELQKRFPEADVERFHRELSRAAGRDDSGSSKEDAL
ncbi:MAG: hypothetical protein K2W95_33520 [Candidatus Obscuribacterales bacterium]|nr:hypothetical protein [Candidatus Obscuribacterales bacterium]